jgi:hypothetical protein
MKNRRERGRKIKAREKINNKKEIGRNKRD